MGKFDRGPRKSFNRGGGGFNRFGPREMHKATCAECGKECEVPFKPTQGRDVFCKECFMKKKKFLLLELETLFLSQLDNC